jgi:hypothetical protein
LREQRFIELGSSPSVIQLGPNSARTSSGNRRLSDGHINGLTGITKLFHRRFEYYEFGEDQEVFELSTISIALPVGHLLTASFGFFGLQLDDK